MIPLKKKFDYRFLIYRFSLIFFTVITLIEITGRIAGLPDGDFDVFFQKKPPESFSKHSENYLYPPNSEIKMNWGLIPYIVRTNNAGFRGDDIVLDKSSYLKHEDTPFRILTIGDSVTDGFFVDNENTWQYNLQNKLSNLYPHNNFEVINGARGGGSIDKELGLLRRFGPDLESDIVILTFVTNDLYEIKHSTLEQLRKRSRTAVKINLRFKLQRFFLTKTVVGELALKAWIAFLSARRGKNLFILPDFNNDLRYEIEGNYDFTNNSELFNKLYSNSDGLLLNNSFSEETETTFKIYCKLLNDLKIECQNQNSLLVFVYFPAYSQIYLKDQTDYINERLQKYCEIEQIYFIDLTEGFRHSSMEKTLHLAPWDYHLNPMGHQLFAEIMADKLENIFANSNVLNGE